MRLLKTKINTSGSNALEIQEFDDTNTPKYAILSHRWGKDELTLQDVEGGITTKIGFKKVQRCCAVAKRDGFDYIWVDTCCIDKTSSAELSEAINSMYLWYFKAHRCYAYLADVPSKTFEESEWFARGWTLQELLAPADLVFLDANCDVLGTKESLQKIISNCTGIPAGILSGDEDLETCSVAQRMSWAAKRSTKRVEDLAYCLLGIFGINMPLLYGEGERAFLRLQEEIIRVSDDHSLFAWESSDDRGGLLATSPAAFKSSGDIIQLDHVDDSHNTLTISSRGVHLNFQLIGMGPQKLGLAILHCKERHGAHNQIAIYVKDLTGTTERFQRVRSTELERLDLTKIRPSQHSTRRACIQTGRLMPAQRSKKFGGSNDIQTYDIYDDDVLDKFINLAQPEALLHASQRGHQDVVWLMLTQRDIDINSKGANKWPALFHAVNNGHEAIVKMLLARGAKINLKNQDGYTPLVLAAENGHEDIVKLLLERGADIRVGQDMEGFQKHFEAATYKEQDTHGYLRPLRDACEKKDEYIQVPVFMWAIKNQQENIIKLLLDRGMEIDLKKKYGPILLHWAATGGHKDTAEWLIDRGVKVDSRIGRYWNGRTPVSMAVVYGNEAIIKLLLENGADIEAKDDYNCTPLLLAVVKKGNTDIIKLLLENGADIEAKDNNGRTPLLWAVIKRRNEDTIKLLLGNGADVTTKDNDGWTPLSWAVREGNEDIIKLLLKNGADVTIKDNDGQTPPSWAAEQADENIAKLLTGKGTRVGLKDNDNWTIL